MTRSVRAGGTGVCVRAAAAGAVVALACLAGCPLPPGNNGNGNDNSGGTPFLDSAGNSSFDTATKLPLASRGPLTFAGRIDSEIDIDVYDLGVLSPGDRVIVDVQRTSGNLDAIAGVFDKREDLVGYSDDRTEDGSDLNPYIDFIVRGDEGTYYLGIAAFDSSGTTGEYTASVSILPGSSVPDPADQIVYLDFRGGTNIVIPNVGTFDLAPFDATDVGPYPGRTADMEKRIRQIVENRYADFKLQVISSEDALPPAVPHTTVYFGGNNPRAFAISEKIDPYDSDLADRSIIFTSSFPASFSHTPSFDEISDALGNTVAHEVGHLLGLVHTASCSDLMDTTCNNDRILQDQSFTDAPLDSSVFPIGTQNSPELLDWILGTSN